MTMQSAPKKGKHTAVLKNTHVEQLTKLQHKNQQEVDLLEDLRIFSKSRSTIEKEYAQALVKLGEQFLTKRKFPPPPTFKSDDGKEYKTVWAVWRTVLEETRRVGEMRLQAAETYLQQISEPAKPLRANKQQVAKKVFDQCSTLQKEVSIGVQEMAKSQKLYSEEEQIAHDARCKARDAEAKLNKKSTGIFTSMSKLQQNCSKLGTRRDACESKATAARNDYLINLASTNAHQCRYYNTDLPHLIQTLDGEMYDKVQEFFTTLARSELECCGLTQECFMKILTDSCMVSREFNLSCFLRENLVFSDCVQYNFEPQAEDPITVVSPEYGAGEQLEREAGKWATRVTHESRLLRDTQRQIDAINEHAVNGEVKSQTGSENSKGEKTDKSASLDTDKLDDLRIAMRRAETGKAKADAVIEVLQTGGLDMEEHMRAAEEQLARQAEEEEARRRAVSTSSEVTDKKSQRDSGVLSESSHDPNTSVNSSGGNPAAGGAPSDSTYINYEDDDFDGDAFGSSPHHLVENTSLSTGYHSMSTSGRNYPQPCMALYDFKSSNADEMSLTENEMLEVIADGDGDGWVRARNSAGQEGFVPENYVQLTSGDMLDHNEVNVDTDYPSAHASPARHGSTSSHTGTLPSQHSAGTDTINSHNSHNSNYSATDYEVQQAVNNKTPTVPEEGDWARALYDYDATNDEELSFREGQLIRIIRRDENGVDDGWWEGQLDGKVGVFPSLVVEEIGGQEGSCSGTSQPHLPAPQLAVTQPTPTDGSYSQYYGRQYNYNSYNPRQRSESSV